MPTGLPPSLEQLVCAAGQALAGPLPTGPAESFPGLPSSSAAAAASSPARAPKGFDPGCLGTAMERGETPFQHVGSCIGI